MPCDTPAVAEGRIQHCQRLSDRNRSAAAIPEKDAPQFCPFLRFSKQETFPASVSIHDFNAGPLQSGMDRLYGLVGNQSSAQPECQAARYQRADDLHLGAADTLSLPNAPHLPQAPWQLQVSLKLHATSLPLP